MDGFAGTPAPPARRSASQLMGLLADFVAGILMLMLRPYKVGVIHRRG